MSSAYYLSICIQYAHYLQWSLICSFLTDNANVIPMSSLVLFINPIMYNLVSAHCLHRCIHCPCHLHVVHTCTHHLLVIFTTPHIPYYPQFSFRTLSPHTSHCLCHLYIVYRCICYVHLISTAVIYICTCHPHII